MSELSKDEQIQILFVACQDALDCLCSLDIEHIQGDIDDLDAAMYKVQLNKKKT